MKKTITMDYEEYLKISEKAVMKDNEIKREIFKELREQEEQREACYKWARTQLLNEILLKCNLYTNSFGYIKAKDIEKYIIDKI